MQQSDGGAADAAPDPKFEVRITAGNYSVLTLDSLNVGGQITRC